MNIKKNIRKNIRLPISIQREFCFKIYPKNMVDDTIQYFKDFYNAL